MKERLDKFIDEITLLGLYDVNRIGIIMHPNTMRDLLKEIGCDDIGRIDLYKGIRVLIDPSCPIGTLYSKHI